MIGTSELPAQLTAEVAAVAVGQGQVEQDEVRRVTVDRGPRGGGRPHHLGGEARPAQCQGERLRDRRLVLHEQHSGRGHFAVAVAGPQPPPPAGGGSLA